MNKKVDSLLEKLKEMPQFVEVSGLQNEKNGLLNVMSGLYVKEEVNIVAKGERSKGGIGMINHLTGGEEIEQKPTGCLILSGEYSSSCGNFRREFKLSLDDSRKYVKAMQAQASQLVKENGQ